MSEVITDKLTGRATAGDVTITAGTSATMKLQDGIAKVWCQLDGAGTAQVDGSLNIASLTDNGTGDYDINYTNALANTNYAITTSTEYTFSSSLVIATYNESNKNAGDMQVVTNQTDEGGSVDVPEASVAIFGDLA